MIDLDLELPEKNSATTPPFPSERVPPLDGDDGTFLLLPPPSPNLVGFWRSRKMYRVTSAGWPPQTKILATPLNTTVLPCGVLPMVGDVGRSPQPVNAQNISISNACQFRMISSVAEC